MDAAAAAAAEGESPLSPRQDAAAAAEQLGITTLMNAPHVSRHRA